MPIFEYRCKQCGECFEKLVRKDDPVSCPQCGSQELSKLFSTFGVKSGGKFTPSGESACSTCSAASCEGCKG